MNRTSWPVITIAAAIAGLVMSAAVLLLDLLFGDPVDWSSVIGAGVVLAIVVFALGVGARRGRHPWWVTRK